MGANFEKLEEYKKSLYYFQKAKVILKNNKLYFDRKSNYLTSISDNLSIVYVKLGMFQKALDELKSINLNNIINECPNDYAAVAGNLGMVYLKIGRKHKAKKYFLEALNTAKREKNLNTEMYQYINLGEYYLKL
jgi:tetratricopeptide (TPR) repeat protein